MKYKLNRIIGMGFDWETLKTTIRRARILKISHDMRVDVIGLRGYSNFLYSREHITKNILEGFSAESPEDLQGKPVTAIYHCESLAGIQRRD